jgi:hypothetical protein
MHKRIERFVACCGWLVCISPALAEAQTVTYHLHQESSTEIGLLQLKATGPDTTAKVKQFPVSTTDCCNKYRTMNIFNLPANVPDLGGVIPTGTTFNFTMWMRITEARGTVFPGGAMTLNFSGHSFSKFLCESRGTTALTTTLAPYTFSCAVGQPIPVEPTDRLTFWPEYYTTSYAPRNGKNGGMSVEYGMEGMLLGSADSRFDMVVPLDPRITQLTPTSGGEGTSITISGANFGSTQGSSTITIDGVDVIPTGWSPSQIWAVVPQGANHGPVQVTVNARPSNPWMFIGAWTDTQCQPQITPQKSNSINWTGGTLALNITAVTDCVWTVQGLPTWLTPNVTTATGSGGFNLTAPQNSGAARIATFTVNGVPVAVTQQGSTGLAAYHLTAYQPPSIAVLNGLATCSLDVNTVTFLGMDIYINNQRVATSWGAGIGAFNLQASASVPIGSDLFVSCIVFGIDEGFVVSEGSLHHP